MDKRKKKKSLFAVTRLCEYRPLRYFYDSTRFWKSLFRCINGLGKLGKQKRKQTVTSHYEQGRVWRHAFDGIRTGAFFLNI